MLPSEEDQFSRGLFLLPYQKDIKRILYNLLQWQIISQTRAPKQIGRRTYSKEWARKLPKSSSLLLQLRKEFQPCSIPTGKRRGRARKGSRTQFIMLSQLLISNVVGGRNLASLIDPN